jgi:hypothetical protein
MWQKNISDLATLTQNIFLTVAFFSVKKSYLDIYLVRKKSDEILLFWIIVSRPV